MKAIFKCKICDQQVEFDHVVYITRNTMDTGYVIYFDTGDDAPNKILFDQYYVFLEVTK